MPGSAILDIQIKARDPAVDQQIGMAPFLPLWSCGLAGLFSFSILLAAAEQAAQFLIGAATVDITPAYSVRLSGYAARTSESEGVEQRIRAKALAIQNVHGPPAVLITVDNCGVPADVTSEIARRITKKAAVPRERIVICSSHTHSAPCLSGALQNLFVSDLPADQTARIDRYTAELINRIEEAAMNALAQRQPGKLYWTRGQAQFARNRRTPGGPVDHSLPLLIATDREDRPRVLVGNYACHCTTLGGPFNRICGDWAGYAQEMIEQQSPGLLAMMTIGCGADANPFPRGRLEDAQAHGREIADEVNRLLQRNWKPLPEQLTCRTQNIRLPFEELHGIEEWERRAAQPGIVGYHARKNLERIKGGEQLPRDLPYLIQTWNFGGDLAMVFLAGEVVVDYALRLKRELDVERLWITAYANDVPCYIPSKRILQEGGYEAEGSLWYYDRPARLAPEVEDLIVRTVRQLVPNEFIREPKRMN